MDMFRTAAVECSLLTHVRSRYFRSRVFIRERPLARPRRRWEDNIKMNLKEMGEGGGMY